MECWKTRLLMIAAMLLSVPWLVLGNGIPHNLNLPSDFLTYDPYNGDPHLDSPISITDDVNDVLHTAHKKPLAHFPGVIDTLNFHHGIHPSIPIRKKKPVHSSFHSSSLHHSSNPHDSFSPHHSSNLHHSSSPHHSPLPTHPIQEPHASFHSSHGPDPNSPFSIPPVKPIHSSFHSSHGPHFNSPLSIPPVEPINLSFHSSQAIHHESPLPPVHPPKSSHSVHTSASNIHPLYPVFTHLNLDYDPYLYTNPHTDEGAYFPEHGYNMVDKIGAVHNDFSGPHDFPSFGYNLDPYFTDFPIFGYFDYTPKYDDHHRRRRGTTRQPYSHGQPATLGGIPHPLVRRVSRSKLPERVVNDDRPRMPLLPQVRDSGKKSEFFGNN